MPEKHRPRRGSLAYTPKKRAKKERPRIRTWPEEEEAQLLGFAGYKAGMTHVFMVDDHPDRPTQGQEINVPVTILEVPPLNVSGIRIYGKDFSGEKALTEVWDEYLSEELDRLVKMPQEYDQEAAFENAGDFIDEGMAEEVVALVNTQPKMSSVPKKKPELMEVRLGGDSPQKQWEFAKEVLGEEIGVSDVFSEGKYADAFAITKGKGFEGPVQRWGIKVQTRKVQQAQRHTGVLSPWRPSRIMRSVPMSGQSGYHQRMDQNKRILKMGDDGEEVTDRKSVV